MTNQQKKTIHRLIGRLGEFTYQHPRCGKFFSGYGTGLFTCECFFDALFLYLVGYDPQGEIAVNLLRLLISQQNPQTGHIPRHTVDLVEDPNRLNTAGWSAMSVFENGRQVNPWTWYESEEHAQPCLCQIAFLVCRERGGDAGWLEGELYQGLKKYLACWLRDWDKTGDGLCVVASAQHGLSDNAFSRAGTWRSYFAQLPDFNALLYIELTCMAKMARALGRAGDAAYFEDQAAIKRQRVNQALWDEEAGCYFPRDIRTGKLIRVDAVNHYLPLWAGIVPKDRAERMVGEHLLNPQKLYAKFPFSSYAQDERTYTQRHVNDTILLDDFVMLPEGHCNWRGGCWAHPHYMLTQALSRYGYGAEARAVADKVFEMTIDNPYVCEWHTAETGEMTGAEIFAGAQLLQRLMPTLLEAGFDVDFAADALDKPLDNQKVLALLAEGEQKR